MTDSLCQTKHPRAKASFPEQGFPFFCADSVANIVPSSDHLTEQWPLPTLWCRYSGIFLLGQAPTLTAPAWDRSSRCCWLTLTWGLGVWTGQCACCQIPLNHSVTWPRPPNSELLTLAGTAPLMEHFLNFWDRAPIWGFLLQCALLNDFSLLGIFYCH